jgi:hypothetical protein
MPSLSTVGKYALLIVVTLVTRMIYLCDGYGVEEDSWGLVVNAYEMKAAGHYVASRFPGHPLQEYVYSFIYDASPLIYNLLSAIMSVFAVFFFYAALRKIQFNNAFWAALALSFTPCFFIAGTYTIDFAWAMAFILASFYYLIDRKFILSGILLGMAIGCRITSGAFLLVWILLLINRINWRESVKPILALSIPTAIVGIAWFIPAWSVYGKSFFDYSDQFAYPPMTKVLYKASIGVFGLIGIAAIGFYLIPALKNIRKKELQAFTHFTSERLLFAALLAVGLMLVSYLRLPQKSGYILPAVPFVILFFAVALNQTQFRIFSFGFLLAPYLMSINLTDSIRGAEPGKTSIRFTVSGQEIFLDPFSGPIHAEQSKRVNKIMYCDSVMHTLVSMDSNTVVVAGWWYNELHTVYLQNQAKKTANPKPTLWFYADCNRMDSAIAKGCRIYYLPEQNRFNDEMFQQKCTDQKAIPFRNE